MCFVNASGLTSPPRSHTVTALPGSAMLRQCFGPHQPTRLHALTSLPGFATLCVWIHEIGAESNIEFLLFCHSIRLTGVAKSSISPSESGQIRPCLLQFPRSGSGATEVVYLHRVLGKGSKAVGRGYAASSP